MEKGRRRRGEDQLGQEDVNNQACYVVLKEEVPPTFAFHSVAKVVEVEAKDNAVNDAYDSTPKSCLL